MEEEEEEEAEAEAEKASVKSGRSRNVGFAARVGMGLRSITERGGRAGATRVAEAEVEAEVEIEEAEDREAEVEEGPTGPTGASQLDIG
jgi:hypothetical protein